MVMQGDAAGSESNANAVDRNQQLTNALNPKKNFSLHFTWAWLLEASDLGLGA